MDLNNKLIDILTNQILNDTDVVIEATNDLLTTGTIDSMALIRFVAAIEEEFTIKIPATDLIIDNFINIESIGKYVSKKINS